ncbi:hypothetical protein DFP72DRAFT_1054770 [Ephemerocybe angulata]|uniref:Uncharacterized protein n=1 Tax=Ephemerocybe angulata TaxID=980116 RepID=A0A8H6LTK4_9AGAR|nr:hypothetical protein DFP72DRAFT_1054770 [Tulosesus angulatus]
MPVWQDVDILGSRMVTRGYSHGHNGKTRSIASNMESGAKRPTLAQPPNVRARRRSLAEIKYAHVEEPLLMAGTNHQRRAWRLGTTDQFDANSSLEVGEQVFWCRAGTDLTRPTEPVGEVSIRRVSLRSQNKSISDSQNQGCSDIWSIWFFKRYYFRLIRPTSMIFLGRGEGFSLMRVRALQESMIEEQMLTTLGQLTDRTRYNDDSSVSLGGIGKH